MRLKKLGKLLTSKFLLVCFLLLIEIAIIPAVFYWFFFSVDTTWIFAVLCAAVVILDLAIALWIVNSDMNAEYKIAWLMPVLFLPPIGALLYLNLRRRPRPRRRLKQLAEKFAGMECLYVKKDGHVGTEYAGDGFAASCAEYVAQATGLPPTDCYEFEYFPSGESYCERLLEELEKAEKYIFLEYFILRPGKFWNSVLDILKRKAGEGVDVRVIYDDIDLAPGMLGELQKKFPEKELDLILGSYFDVPLGIAVFDGAVSVESLHHFTREEKIPLYARLREALKEGGYFILTDYFALSEDEEKSRRQELLRLREMQGLAEDVFYHYDTPLTVEHEAEALRAAGFTAARIFSPPPVRRYTSG